MDEIVSLISSTVDIVKVIKPVYNFKASKPVTDDEVADGED